MKKVIINEDNFDFKILEDIIFGEIKGEIPLAIPVANINDWYGKRSSPYALMSGLTQDEMEEIIYYSKYVIINEDKGSFQLVTEKESIEAKKNNEKVVILTGMEAIKEILNRITKEDVEDMISKLRKKEREYMAKLEEIYEKEDDENEEEEIIEAEEDDCSDNEEREKSEKDILREELYFTRRQLESAWYFKKYRLSRLEINTINMIPLQVKAILREELKTLPYSIMDNLENLYRNIIYRNARIKKLTEIDAPEIIIRNEKRILQENVDALINSKKRKVETMYSNENDRIISLTDIVMRSIKLV